MSEHDLLPYPSHYWSAGYPGTILEACPWWPPGRWGGVSELVEHEKNGLLVEPHSAVAVQSAIEKLLQDPELYRRLCESAKRWRDCFRSVHWHNNVAEDLRGLCRQQAIFQSRAQNTRRDHSIMIMLVKPASPAILPAPFPLENV